ncbi:hypothetical protein CIL05_01225 [Virgibacillus profundi]|uniref:Uncharacterized protein n=1 Tax=Virgibacillus profundi TaxID=2024555 RepID=A0A2A2IIE1_9BACI|nr:hypothetical protein [Virgibacillus profundi]PAV31302.1 hypothetical protein CIL05_01225 [Virgibacillus profundi]PXY55487.1 hypothetical protein CIT14_01230 [Virgibacillus profundi]
MRKLLFMLILITILAACSNEDTNESPVEKGDSSEQEQEIEKENNSEVDNNQHTDDEESEEDREKENEEVEGDGENNEEDSTEDIGLIKYRPEAGTSKTFMQNDEFEITYEILAANEQYIQRIISFGDNITLQILEWTPDSIAIVYQEENPTDTSDQLDSFEAYEPPITLVDSDSLGEGNSSDWEIVSTDETVKVPFGEFSEVYLVKQTFESDTTGDKTISQAFYAPNMGLVKETVEVTGDNGYEITTELENTTKN